jgi:hypothetical protein
MSVFLNSNSGLHYSSSRNERKANHKFSDLDEMFMLNMALGRSTHSLPSRQMQQPHYIAVASLSIQQATKDSLTPTFPI